VRSKPYDALIGLAVVAAAAFVIWYILGIWTVIWVFGLLLYGIVILNLWSSKSIAAKALAIVLMPAILLVYLVPKSTRRVIQSGSTGGYFGRDNKQ
jgi:hypothetical protein